MRVDHLGIAVRHLEDAVPVWETALGGSASAPETVPNQKVRVAFLEVGGTYLEFLEPTTADSAVGRFLEQRGAGMHHVALGVPNVDRKLAELKARGYAVVDEVGRPGARGRRVGFAHPAAFGGVLVEFVERP